MAKQDDGGPAFPAPSVYGDENVGHQCLERGEYGMSLRDYFAGQALAGIVGTLTAQDVLLLGGSDATSAVTAAFAYGLADAMLKARTQTGNVATQETQS